MGGVWFSDLELKLPYTTPREHEEWYRVPEFPVGPRVKPIVGSGDLLPEADDFNKI